MICRFFGCYSRLSLMNCWYVFKSFFYIPSLVRIWKAHSDLESAFFVGLRPDPNAHCFENHAAFERMQLVTTSSPVARSVSNTRRLGVTEATFSAHHPVITIFGAGLWLVINNIYFKIGKVNKKLYIIINVIRSIVGLFGLSGGAPWATGGRLLLNRR